MPARKMRVEVYDEAGNRYTIAFEGTVTRDKALRLLDLVELLGGVPGSRTEWRNNPELSKFDKIRLVTEKHFPVVWFASREIQTAYEKEFNEPISLSTVSTYLGRMAGRHILAKGGALNNRRYRLITEISRLAHSY